jgi:hypothetical protein
MSSEPTHDMVIPNLIGLRRIVSAEYRAIKKLTIGSYGVKRNKNMAFAWIEDPLQCRDYEHLLESFANSPDALRAGTQSNGEWENLFYDWGPKGDSRSFLESVSKSNFVCLNFKDDVGPYCNLRFEQVPELDGDVASTHIRIDGRRLSMPGWRPMSKSVVGLYAPGDIAERVLGS